jgi:hypothetical protein
MRVPLPAAITTTSTNAMNLIPSFDQIISQRGWGGRWLGRCLALGLAACLSACSLVVTGYNNAPQALMFMWIDPHLDLTTAQSRQTKADLTHVLAWHRQQQLPLYADWLVRMQQLAPHPMQADQVCRLADEMRDSLKPLAAQMEAPLATLAMSLQAAQLQTMKARFDKDNASWRKEWKLDSSSQDRLEVQTEKGQKNAERFYGKLSQAQQAQLRLLAQSSGFDAERTHAERLRQQADMLQTLQTIGTGQRNLTTAGPLVRDWLQRSLKTPDEDYAAYLKKRQALNCQAAAQFHNSTTAEQRVHAVKVLQSYEADVRELMRTSP